MEWTGRVVTDTRAIADKVEELCNALEWTNEAYALSDGAVDCGWSDDDTRGWLRLGPVSVEWLRDPYGDGLEDWVAVEVTVDGMLFDSDGYSHLDDAVMDAARTTMEWQHYRDVEIRDAVAGWLDDHYEAYHLDGPQDGDSWTITWGDVMVRGYYDDDDDGAFVWSVVNPETADYLDGDASDDADAVIDAMTECAKDLMVEAWVETVAMETAEDDWAVRSSEDQMTVYAHSSIAYGMSRRAYYESVGYAAGRIELEYRVRGSEWRAYDEMLPEDEEDVRRMAREAYAWVRSIDD